MEVDNQDSSSSCLEKIRRNRLLEKSKSQKNSRETVIFFKRHPSAAEENCQSKSVSFQDANRSISEEIEDEEINRLLEGIKGGKRPEIAANLEKIAEIFAGNRAKNVKQFIRISKGNFYQTLLSLIGSKKSTTERNRLAALDCLVQISLSQEHITLKKVAANFGSQLRSMTETDGETLVIKSCYAIGNLCHGGYEKRGVRELLVRQGVLISLVRSFTRRIHEIQESGALIFAISGFVCNRQTAQSTIYADIVIEGAPRFAEFLVSEIEKSFHTQKLRNKSELLELHGSWLLFFLISLTKQPVLSVSAVSILLDIMDSICTNGNVDSKLQIVVPLMRTVSNCFACSTWTFEAYSTHFMNNMSRICRVFLSGKHVALRKESLWILYNFVLSESGTGSGHNFAQVNAEKTVIMPVLDSLFLALKLSFDPSFMELGARFYCALIFRGMGGSLFDPRLWSSGEEEPEWLLNLKSERIEALMTPEGKKLLSELIKLFG